jgi:diguanylate cyclase (GGDEF)-like protein
MYPRSFRARLTWFFLIIVILPMVMVTLVLFRLVADSEQGKADARLAQGLTSATELYRTDEDRAAVAGKAIGRSAALSEAIESGDRNQIEEQLAAAAQQERAVYVRLEGANGETYESGDPDRAVGTARTVLVDRESRPAGTLIVSTRTAQGLIDAIKQLTKLDAAVTTDGTTVASTIGGLEAASLPTRGERDIDGEEFHVSSFTAEGVDAPFAVRVLGDAKATQDATSENRVVVALLLVAFLVLALAFAFTVSRSLQAQIQRLLQAARRLGSGQLDVEVPTDGNDEFAALGTEFNAMARQLEGRLEELGSERERLQLAIRRVGESLATRLDRDALLEIVVQTAVDGVAATAGRASVRDAPGGPLENRADVGAPKRFAAVLDAAENAVLQTREPTEVSTNDHHALAHPLRPSEGSEKVIGLISVARQGKSFSPADRDLFNYLAGQAAVSIENVDLHETVQRQAVTDELTGLFNHRRFQEVMSVEVERAKRYGQTLGLIMLDIDDFKSVNDQHGHLQGDQVLREVARVVLDSSREIDEPARYGGEEMAVALPQTDLEGAFLFAERLRSRIEELEVPLLQGHGMVKVTASVGAAALADTALADKDVLVQAADAALYRAKRLGKNRVVKAG